MGTVKTLYNQRLIDISMQELGDVERVFELCVLNGMGLTENMPAGTDIIYPVFDNTKRRIVNLFKDDSLKPASADDIEDLPVDIPPGGIGYMQIGNDFIVS